MTAPDPPPLTLVPARHRRSLAALRRDRWIGSREGGPPGNTQDALVRLGVAEGRWATKPYGRAVARLTELGVRYLETHDPAWRAAEEARAATASAVRRIAEQRVAAGVCRHCGGAVPCWSPYGDVEVGVRHGA